MRPRRAGRAPGPTAWSAGTRPWPRRTPPRPAGAPRLLLQPGLVGADQAGHRGRPERHRGRPGGVHAAGDRAGQRPQRGAGGRVLGQAPGDHRTEPRRYPVQDRLGVHHPVQDGGRRPGAERSRPRRRVGHHAAEREHVARGSRAPALGLLGRHVPRRAEHHPGRRQRGSVDGARDAEVDHPRPVGGQQHVGGLEVAVHHAAGVDRLQRLDQPGQQRPQRLLGQRPVFGHHLVQGRPWDERGGQPRRPLVRARWPRPARCRSR